MMRALRIVTAIACIIAFAVPCLAMMNKVGTAGALFLKVCMDPRRVSMGEASAAIVGDASSALSNPAGLAGLNAM